MTTQKGSNLSWAWELLIDWEGTTRSREISYGLYSSYDRARASRDRVKSDAKKYGHYMSSARIVKRELDRV